MSSIEELQKRVSEAEQRFGLIKAQRAKYSERLVGLIDAIESRLRDQHAEIERQAAEITAQSEELNTTRNAVAENQALRGMLHSLLRAIETGGRDVLNETMQVMDAKVSTLIQSNVKAVPALGHAGMDEIEADLGELEAAEEIEPSEPAIAELDSPEAVGSDFGSPDPESTEAAVVDEAVPDDVLESIADRVTPDATSEDDPLAALDSGLEDVPAAEPEMAAEELPAELPEPAAEDVPAVAELDASEGDAMLAEEPPAEAEVPEPEIADVSEIESELEPEFDAQSEPEPEPMVAELAPDAELPEAIETDAEIGGPGTLEGFDDSGEAATLEEIMRRVSRLVEEEGALGKPTRGSVRIGAEPSAEKPKAASNG